MSNVCSSIKSTLDPEENSSDMRWVILLAGRAMLTTQWTLQKKLFCLFVFKCVFYFN